MIKNEKKNFKLAVVCSAASFFVAVCGSACAASGGTAAFSSRKATAISSDVIPPSTRSFHETLASFNMSRWHMADWSNGGYFLNSWHPGQLVFHNGTLSIQLQADPDLVTGKSAVSGEYRTHQNFRYGLYQARIKASNTPGTINGFFLYTGPAEGTQHDEIDIEIKGDDPTQIQVNYWSGDVEHPTLIDLGFDASVAEHDYAFRWAEGRIEWFVDGKLVHQEDGSDGPLPVTPGKIILNHWGTVGAAPWSSEYEASATPSVMTISRVGFTSESMLAARTYSNERAAK
jgi:beta-glucanase (GH16 family)